ncbi:MULTISPECIES: hypothetical protein [Bradyrhizobium]|uniref:hypothetical protein n=1 Tax=Bradyrhizobium TaxID=374 RepID=UPI000375F486|nr:hypothetical protein [Bradyrhizobium elkanii]MCP1975306.1 hypothetical protein [Bradyrhizobium elkanii]MCS3522424.1 hypothetical protein [Bradyrhizobium elkanii]MCS3617784.1 hypothetical protein [Bradyrhizobium elkanii]MCS4070078.1 hypothetical protein [Bradyrhizobium elkanii]MCS4076709.1 hypothetical protein [Bradyrhizobium elkanii]
MCSTDRKAIEGVIASLSRSASVRCAVSSVSRRSVIVSAAVIRALSSEWMYLLVTEPSA